MRWRQAQSNPRSIKQTASLALNLQYLHRWPLPLPTRAVTLLYLTPRACPALSCTCSFADMRGDIQEIFKRTPHDKQVMMFSATLSKEIRPVCKKFMNEARHRATARVSLIFPGSRVNSSEPVFGQCFLGSASDSVMTSSQLHASQSKAEVS